MILMISFSERKMQNPHFDHAKAAEIVNEVE